MSVATDALLEVTGLEKRYGRVRALRGANFTAYRGEVVALVGDNGAGKSTLVKCLSGVVRPDVGEIRLAGDVLPPATAESARSAGIETVYQDLALAPDLDAAANLFMGRELTMKGVLGRLGVLDKKEMRRRTQESFQQLSVGVQDPGVRVSLLSGGQRQSVAVARAIAWASTLVLLDEPTAALGVVQTNRVHDLITRLREAGKTIVLVSHDLEFVLRVANRIEVLRLGRRVARFTVSPELDPSDVLGAMTGVVSHEGV